MSAKNPAFSILCSARYPALGACIAVVILATICPARAQQQVDGLGYINLRAPTNPWTPTTDLDVTPRLFWQPSTNIFRVGVVNLSAAHFGSTLANSFAFGSGTVSAGAFLFNGTSAGAGSFVFGAGASAVGTYGDFTQIAFGKNSYATNSGIAIGESANAQAGSYTIGAFSLASSQSFAFGHMANAANSSIVFGQSSYANKQSIALGNEASAGSAVVTGGVALGYSALALGQRSTALGYDSTATTDYSVALGHDSTTNAIGQMRLGKSAVAPTMRGSSLQPSVSAAAPEDPVFVVGNGVDINGEAPPNMKSPLIIYRDGQSHFTNTLRVAPGGDLSMGDFTDGHDPR